jgi:hypothetical protein
MEVLSGPFLVKSVQLAKQRVDISSVIECYNVTPSRPPFCRELLELTCRRWGLVCMKHDTR